MENLKRLVLVVFVIITFGLSPYIYDHYFVNMELSDGACENFVVLDKIIDDEIVSSGSNFVMSVTWPYLKIANDSGRIFVLKILPKGVDKYDSLEFDEHILICRKGENFEFTKYEYI